MNSHWSLSDSKSLQFYRTHLSILADLNKAVVWMISTHPLISESSSPCTYPLVTVPRASIINGITVTFMFHSFFQFPGKVHVLILLLGFFRFYSVISQNSKVHNSVSSLFLLTIGRLPEVGWSIYILKSQSSLCISFLNTDSGVCMFKSKFFALFPVGPLSHPVVYCLILFLS